ncbi:glycosyltransferase [Bombella mellum]|uniref:Glycosyltransferase n=1 Tax=Bombella mellum TaxID=2039288 RepID=A0ABR5ZS13_9PROT|nr:glycosyltransferase [Bombella mellum]MBA5726984.1 hypothetical protein [Bombella mellum]
MSYTDFDFSRNEQLPIHKNKKCHWDIAISCYEPLDLVTGGIGTYTRMLLELFSSSPATKNKKIAFFCRFMSHEIKRQLASNIKVFEIGDDWQIYHKRAERVGNEHDWYSWNLSHYLLSLSLQGHSFGLFEFSDYAVEAYYPLKMHRAGLVKIDTVAVRLHSPELMLFRDNCLPGRHYDLNRFTRMSRELFCYEHADIVLYGAPAMLDRVQLECNRFGVDIRSKSRHIEHPYPISKIEAASKTTVSNNRTEKHIRIAYVGRMEIRKGILFFLEKISQSPQLLSIIEDLDIVFELFGADCTDQYYNSVQKQILRLQQNDSLRGRIVIHGYMSQQELHEATKNVNGFIFPSIFENYPNALLEILHTPNPVLISSAGGMPYISRDLPGIHVFNYQKNFEHDVKKFFCSIRQCNDRPRLYDTMAQYNNKNLVSEYVSLSSKKRINNSILQKLNVDFVIPYYNDSEYLFECLSNIKKILQQGDKIFIVDDASRKEETQALHKIVENVFPEKMRSCVTVKTLQKNSGPSVARNTGSQLGKNPLIQFIDSDDALNRTGFLVSKIYLERNLCVDFTYGIQDNYGYRNHIWMPRDSSIMTALDENYTHSAILIRRSTFEEAGGFDDELRLHFEDWQFNCKLAIEGYRGETIPFVTQHYRVRNTSRTYLNLGSENFSREQVIDRTCINRSAKSTLLEGELIELLGKYANMIHGRWNGKEESLNTDPFQPLKENLRFCDLLNLEGNEFVQGAYGTLLGRRPDEEGLNFYAKKLRSDRDKYVIISDIMHSQEFKNKNKHLPKEYYKAIRFIGLKRKIFSQWH